MDYTECIIDLYHMVYESQKTKFRVSGNNIRKAIHIMKDTYLPKPSWRSDVVNTTADFNNPAHRCAYLHKYAMVHTGLLCHILQTVFQQPHIQQDLSFKNRLNVCSLGGGPGTDVVSLLFILWEIFESKQCSVTVIDYFYEWKQVFESIVTELKTGRYGDVNNMVSSRSFDYQYLSGDLLNLSHFNAYKVLQTVQNADIITMVKFISAVACDKTMLMVETIFQNMKLGAMLLFVDNAAGGFDRMIREVAYACGMQSVYGPVEHYEYDNPNFSLIRLGYTSQSKTKVCIEVWKKTSPIAYNTTQQLQCEFVYGPSRGETFENRRSHGRRRNRRNAYSAQNIRLGAEERNEGCCSIM